MTSTVPAGLQATRVGNLGGQLWKAGAQAPTVLGGRTFIPAAWYPGSSQNGYTVCEVSDGTTSCNCMGWTRRNPPTGRTCKHVQDYEAFLRPLWNQQQASPHMAPAPVVLGEPAVQAPERTKGGTLSELFAKLEKEGFGGS